MDLTANRLLSAYTDAIAIEAGATEFQNLKNEKRQQQS
jgi:hypothetical protein